MTFNTPSIRLTIALVVLTVNLLFLANMLGFIPDTSESTLEVRKILSESLALQFSSVAEKGQFQIIQNTLREVVERNNDLRSAAIRTEEGQLIALAGQHLAHWTMSVDGKSTPTHIHVPLFKNGEKWATIEMRFAPLLGNNMIKNFTNSFSGLVIFMALSGFIFYFLILKRTLRELDPTAVIPERVQKAFDTLKEGVLVLDKKEQIVMANTSFASFFNKEPENFIGMKGSELGWMNCRTPKQVKELPWFQVLRDGIDQISAPLNFVDCSGKHIKVVASAAMVTDNKGNSCGSLVTFDDITQIEEKNFELNDLVEKLQLSNDEIQVKSQELEFLANHDPLTMCLNRRSMDRRLTSLFNSKNTENGELSCMMVDIDHFKLVNDRYGHAVGDQVIKTVADVLKSSTRDSDLVARYGGEEFCVILPDTSQKVATEIAEKLRLSIEKSSCAGVKVTVSLGTSSLNQHPNKPDELVNQADKALYAAKQSGRNRVISWGLDIQQEALEEVSTVYSSSQKQTETGENKNFKRRIQELEGLLEKQSLEFQHFQMYDMRTGLPTRSLFEDRFSREIARGRRNDFLVVVLSISIEAIKRVNETMGHKVADLLVKACGHRLNDVLRENIDTVALLDDDEKQPSSVSLINQTEFAVLLTEIKQLDSVTWIVKRLLDSFERPFSVKGHEFHTPAFLGVSVFPHDGQTVEELYSGAVNASNFAKKDQKKERYFFASQNLNNQAIKQLQMENALHLAIQNDELEIHYQPKINAKTGQATSVEALLRWNSKILGQVSPVEFIPVSEHSGQIDQLGDWVLYNSCKQLSQWLKMGLQIESVAVNLSGVQLRQKDLPRRIMEILKKFNLTSSHLEIELTESSLVNFFDKDLDKLKQIKDLGIRVTMDDFGTGYSSLSYLKDIPMSCLKIDRSFTMDIGKEQNSEKLISTIISMAHGMGLEVVAEGIEEKYQADFLTELGCEYLQGYYFSRPLHQDHVVDFMKNKTTV
jgi:diguanylate cyclase (GGDEF)-like protein